ncbi:MAG: hypothetical protein RL748_491 [Pseudomonadota bacterium]|jgi:hypothetical protein
MQSLQQQSLRMGLAQDPIFIKWRAMACNGV